MFRVHFPATSYLRKQIPFTLIGTAEMLNIITNPLIRKAGVLEYVDGRPHSGYPHEKLLFEDPEERDHPPWNHDGEGNPMAGPRHDGMHPIEFIRHDLKKRYGLSDDKVSEILQRAIDMYNHEHSVRYGDNASHLLPDHDNKQWLKVFAGPTVEYKDPAHMRVVRGHTPLEHGPRPFMTYGYNADNVPHSLASTGRFMEAGYHHMNKELGVVLKEELMSRGISEKEIDGLDYVKYNRLLPRTLSGGLVQSLSKDDLTHYERTGLRPAHTRTPEHHAEVSSQQAHPEIHAHQLGGLLPDEWFHPQTTRGGEYTSGSKADLNKLKMMMEEHGINAEGFDDNELRGIASTRLMRMLMGGKSQTFHGGAGGAVKTLGNATLNAIGSSHDDENLPMYRSHAAKGITSNIGFAGTANIRAADLVGHIYNAIANAMERGNLSEEEAKEQVLHTLRHGEIGKVGAKGFNYEEGMREKVERLLEVMLGHTGHEALEIGSLPQTAVTSPAPGRMDYGSHAPTSVEHRWLRHDDMAPPGSHQQPQPTPAPAPAPPQEDPFAGVSWGPPAAPAPAAPPPAPAPMAAPRPQVIPVPGMRAATPLEAAWQQMRGQPPSQTFFDIGTGGLVQRSNDVASSLDEIRKKMGYFDGFLGGYRK